MITKQKIYNNFLCNIKIKYHKINNIFLKYKNYQETRINLLLKFKNYKLCKQVKRIAI